MAFSNFFSSLKSQIDQLRKPEDNGAAETQVLPPATPARTPSAAFGPSSKPPQALPGSSEFDYSQRQEHVQRIEAMFGEFGPTVCSFMLAQTLTPGGTLRVLKKLELPSRGREGADQTQIENWILKNGVVEFCQRVGIRVGPAPRPAEPVEAKPAPNLTIRAFDPSKRQNGDAAAPNSVPQASKPYVPPPTYPLPGTPQEPAAAEGPAPVPAPAPAQAVAPAVAPVHTQKISVQPISLAGKDVIRLQSRPPAAPPPPPDEQFTTVPRRFPFAPAQMPPQPLHENMSEKDHGEGLPGTA